MTLLIIIKLESLNSYARLEAFNMNFNLSLAADALYSLLKRIDIAQSAHFVWHNPPMLIRHICAR